MKSRTFEQSFQKKRFFMMILRQKFFYDDIEESISSKIKIFIMISKSLSFVVNMKRDMFCSPKMMYDKVSANCASSDHRVVKKILNT